jgi:hypothetical protein
MIHYQLRCAGGHDFDGWFSDSAAFDAQARAGFVECPTCGTTEVGKRLMAPAIPKKGGRRRKEAAPATAEGGGGADAPEARPPAAPPAPSGPVSGGGMVSGPIPAQLLSLLQRMRSEVERNCEYVGPKFADAARRLHEQQREASHGEGNAAPPPRGIYGEATDAEAEALRDEGIEVARIPWVPRADG